MIETLMLQEARGNRGSIAARAKHDERPIFWKVREALGQMVERDADAAGHALLIALARRADVHRNRLSGGKGHQLALGAEAAVPFSEEDVGARRDGQGVAAIRPDAHRRWCCQPTARSISSRCRDRRSRRCTTRYRWYHRR